MSRRAKPNTDTIFCGPFSSASLFCDPTGESAPRLAEITAPVIIPAGTFIQKPQETPDRVYVFRSGEAALIADCGPARGEALRFAEPGELLNIPYALIPAPAPFAIRAVTECTCDEIETDDLFRFLLADPAAAANFLAAVAAATAADIKKFRGLAG